MENNDKEITFVLLKSLDIYRFNKLLLKMAYTFGIKLTTANNSQQRPFLCVTESCKHCLTGDRPLESQMFLLTALCFGTPV